MDNSWFHYHTYCTTSLPVQVPLSIDGCRSIRRLILHSRPLPYCYHSVCPPRPFSLFPVACVASFAWRARVFASSSWRRPIMNLSSLSTVVLPLAPQTPFFCGRGDISSSIPAIDGETFVVTKRCVGETRSFSCGFVWYPVEPYRHCFALAF